MNAPTSSAAAEKSLPVVSDVEAEISKLVEQRIPKRSPQIETDAERIRSSVSRLTSNSIDGLEGLTSELQDLQEFLKSEVERVQAEIESALAGIKIIIETIAPWKSTPVSLAPPTSTRAVRAGPAVNVEAAQPRR
jgi:exonuclease VII large subunit